MCPLFGSSTVLVNMHYEHVDVYTHIHKYSNFLVHMIYVEPASARPNNDAQTWLMSHRSCLTFIDKAVAIYIICQNSFMANFTEPNFINNVTKFMQLPATICICMHCLQNSLWLAPIIKTMYIFSLRGFTGGPGGIPISEIRFNCEGTFPNYKNSYCKLWLVLAHLVIKRILPSCSSCAWFIKRMC